MKNLLVLNYAMDSQNKLFAHQEQLVFSLADYYNRVTVVTAKSGIYRHKENLEVVEFGWNKGQIIRNSMKLLRVVIPILLKNRKIIVFSHMTDAFSAVIAPVAYFLRIEHYLWYAHAVKSRYLRFAAFFLTGIFTSTPGSCPISTNKVKVIGQAIDSDNFVQQVWDKTKIFNLVHVGRIDPSKQIEKLIDAVISCALDTKNLKLTFIGEPSSLKHKDYYLQILNRYRENIDSGQIVFLGAIANDELTKVLEQYGGFFHAFHGSLDKSLLEATFVGLPVVTINQEYLREFVDISQLSTSATLVERLFSYTKLTPYEIQNNIEINRNIAMEKHSLKHWLDKIVRLM